MKNSIKYLLTISILITSSLSFAGQTKQIFGDWYKFNPRTLVDDLYHPAEEDLLKGNTNYATSQSTTNLYAMLQSTFNYLNLKNDSTSYIWNTNILQSGSTFFVSSGSVKNVFSSSGVFCNYTDYLVNGHIPPHVTGRVYYDNDDKTLAVQLDNPEVTLQVGQETMVRVTNKTGYTIYNGQVVYPNGSQGMRATIDLSVASIPATCEGLVGMATHDISDNENGYVTLFGMVRDLNTLSFNEGDLVYISTWVRGGITNIQPQSPNRRIIMGVVTKKHVSQGVIVLDKVIRDNADLIYTSDFNNYYSSKNVEGALTQVGSGNMNIEIKSTDLTLSNTNYIVTATMPITVTLPSCTNIKGKVYSIDNASTGTVRVNPHSGQTIENETYQELSEDSSMEIISTGITWRIK